MTTILASSPAPSRRTIVPVPYLGCSPTVPVCAGRFGAGGVFGSSMRDFIGGINCAGLALTGCAWGPKRGPKRPSWIGRGGTGGAGGRGFGAAGVGDTSHGGVSL